MTLDRKSFEPGFIMGKFTHENVMSSRAFAAISECLSHNVSSEIEKAMKDAMTSGTGVMLDGEHVPVNQMYQPPPDNWGPWIEWAGGECPVPRETIVQYELRNRVSGQDLAGNFRWKWQENDRSFDIIRYRVKTPT